VEGETLSCKEKRIAEKKRARGVGKGPIHQDSEKKSFFSVQKKGGNLNEKEKSTG